jgi:gentisate 1,2-dioxygenase
MSSLGTIEELPQDYRSALDQHSLLPLWPSLRSFLPYDRPSRSCRPMQWRYDDVRPLLIEAGRLTPIEKAERRVLVLANPSLGLETARATPTIYLVPGITDPRNTA